MKLLDSGKLTAKKLRGFALMDPIRQREIASLGGRAAHLKKTGHEFNSATGREAAKKGWMNRNKGE